MQVALRLVHAKRTWHKTIIHNLVCIYAKAQTTSSDLCARPARYFTNAECPL